MSSARGPQLIHRDPEQAKINRFRFEADKRRSTVARTLLRSVLGTVTGTHPGKLTFDYGEFGKPVLRGGGPDFNLSHSNETVALAVGNTGPIGIDVESVNRTVDPVPLSRTCFSVVEQQALASLADAPTRLAAFFRGWTRKEAFIKALGYGLQAPLDQFDVRLDQDPGNTLLACRLEHTTQAQWQVLDLQLTQNRPAAITVNQAATQTIVVSDVAGLPMTVVYGSTSRVTTAPMPTTAPLPMRSGLSGDPGRSTAAVPMYAWSST